jgi:hypothetical protein
MCHRNNWACSLFLNKRFNRALQGFRSIATKKIVAIYAVSWHYVPIATKLCSLASVAIVGMVISYCNKKAIVAIKCSIATTMQEVATFFPAATLAYLHNLVCQDSLMQHANQPLRLIVCGDRNL